MNRGLNRKPGESGAEPYLSSQFIGLFDGRAFIAGGDPISMGVRRRMIPKSGNRFSEKMKRSCASKNAFPVEKSCQGTDYDRQNELPWIVHRAGHAVQERRARRKGVSRPGGLADRRG